MTTTPTAPIATVSLPPLVALKVENFRSLREVDVEFPDGLIGIVGRNGRGKTSFLRAISFAFYAMGGVPNKWRKERLITRDADGLKIELTFTVAGDQYTVTRGMKRSKAFVIEAELRRDGMAPVTGNDAVTNEIIRLVGPYDKMAISRFVSQKEVNALTVLDPAPRKRLILGLLGVEGVEGALKNLRDWIAEFDQDIKARRSLLPNADTLQADREAVKLRQVALAAQRQELEVEMTSSKDSLTAAEGELARRKQIEDAVSEFTKTMEIQDERLAGLATQIAGVDAGEAEIATNAVRLAEVEALLEVIAAHREELAAANETAALLRDASDLREQQKQLDMRIATGRGTLERLERTAAGVQSLAAEEKRLDVDIRKFAAEFAAAQGERGERRAELMRINKDIEALRAQLAAIGVEAVGACPTCGQAIADEDAFREHLAARERDLEEQKVATTTVGIASKNRSEEAEARQAAADARMMALRTELEAARTAAADIPLARANLERDEADRAQIVADLAALEQMPYDAERHAVLIAESDSSAELIGERGALRASVGKADSLATARAEILERLASSQAVRDKAETAAVAAGYDREATEAAEATAAAAIDAVHGVELRLGELTGEDNRASDALERADKDMAEHGALTKEIDKILDDRGAYVLARKTMEQFKIELIGRIRPALSRKASDLLREMTDGEYADLMLDEEYGISIGNGPMLWDPGEPSGGEDDLANLCLRLAISELIGESSGAGPSFVVLDEVLGSQDDERRELVMAALPRLAGHFRQVLMVAHVPGVQDRFPVVIPAEWDAVTRTSRFIYPPRGDDQVLTSVAD